jgi:hypothetical protein
LIGEETKIKNEEWFFVDYSGNEIEVGEIFDTLLEGSHKTLIPGKTDIKLKLVLDQMGHILNYIPQGFQTICKLEFKDGIPSQLNKLPVYDTWDYNPNSISITNHQLIQLSEPDILIKTMYGLLMVEIKHKIAPNNSIIARKDLVSYLKKRYKIQDREIINLFNKWKLLGMVNERKNEELDLVTEEVLEQ